MEITKVMLKDRFNQYNELYFEGKLTKPKFFFFNSKRNYGFILLGSKDGTIPSKIWISKSANVNDDILKNTLIHEMVHQYVYERLFGLKYQIITHGIKFRYVCWRLHKKYNLKLKKPISIF